MLEERRAILRRTATVYLAISAFCGVFSAVYLHFSFGQSSPFLVLLFAPPLLLGAGPAFFAARSKKRPPARVTRLLWNSAVATLTSGCLVRAVINISGRYTGYDAVYWATAGMLFAAALTAELARNAARAAHANRPAR